MPLSISMEFRNVARALPNNRPLAIVLDRSRPYSALILSGESAELTLRTIIGCGIFAELLASFRTSCRTLGGGAGGPVGSSRRVRVTLGGRVGLVGVSFSGRSSRGVEVRLELSVSAESRSDSCFTLSYIFSIRAFLCAAVKDKIIIIIINDTVLLLYVIYG